MLIASALDESKDEVIIHLTASSMPLVIAIIIRYIITKEFKIKPKNVPLSIKKKSKVRKKVRKKTTRR